MPKNNSYFEQERFCQESQCKYFKRLVVGFIRFIESTDQEANIPEEFFDNVPDTLGFEYDFFESETEDGDESGDIRSFKLTNSWKPGDDDCGGTEEDPLDMNFTAAIPEKNNVIHLRLVKNDD